MTGTAKNHRDVVGLPRRGMSAREAAARAAQAHLRFIKELASLRAQHAGGIGL